MTVAVARRRAQLESFISRTAQMRHPCDRSETGRAISQARQELQAIERQLAALETGE